MGPGHPECPQRLDAIEDRLLITGLDHALERREPTPAALSDVELAHDRMHVAALRGLSDRLIEDMLAGGPTHANVDPDTSINRHTWEAALMAAGENRSGAAAHPSSSLRDGSGSSGKPCASVS